MQPLTVWSQTITEHARLEIFKGGGYKLWLGGAWCAMGCR